MGIRVPVRVDESERRCEICLRNENHRRSSDSCDVHDICRARQRRADPTQRVNANEAPHRNDEGLQQIGRNVVPRTVCEERMDKEHALSELGQVASRQAEHADHEGGQEHLSPCLSSRPLPAGQAAREPPDHHRVGGDFERDKEFVVECSQLGSGPEVLHQAVAAFKTPVQLRPHHFGRGAYRHDAAEDDAVVGEVR